MILKSKIKDPSAWTASTFQEDNTWLIHLDAGQLSQIDRALKLIRGNHLTIDDINSGHFDLPSLHPVIDKIRSDVLAGRGFIVIRGFPVSQYTDEEAEIFFWGLGCQLGKGVSQNAKGDRLGHVFDQNMKYMEGNVRGYQTRSRLPFHTDGSDVVGLLCLRTAKSGGLSSIASSISIYNTLLDESPDLLPILYNGFVYDRKGEHKPGDLGYTACKVPVFSNANGTISCRYIRSFIETGIKKHGIKLTNFERAALDKIDEVAARPEMHLDMALEPGDMQFVNNYTILHSRTEYEDHPEPSRRRHLLRLWINIENAREFSAEFIESQGATSREGIQIDQHD